MITSYPVYAEHGVTVTEALRSDPRTMHVPIFNAATHVLPQELEAAAAAGVSYSLSLPASLATVVAGVRRLLDEPPSPDG